jgi:uncharacterized protein (DUF433 family)
MTLSLQKTSYEHIKLNEEGVPYISGTNMKVVELVLNKLAYGWSPEELHFQHPHLSLGQIYSALAFYHDHKDMLDRDIRRRREKIEEIRKQQPPSPVLSRLKSPHNP